MEEIHCDCIARLDEKLAEYNARILRSFVIGSGSLDLSPAIVCTEQLERGRGKKKAPSLHATYCPFCGLKYGERLAEEAS